MILSIQLRFVNDLKSRWARYNNLYPIVVALPERHKSPPRRLREAVSYFENPKTLISQHTSKSRHSENTFHAKINSGVLLAQI